MEKEKIDVSKIVGLEIRKKRLQEWYINASREIKDKVLDRITEVQFEIDSELEMLHKKECAIRVKWLIAYEIHNNNVKILMN